MLRGFRGSWPAALFVHFQPPMTLERAARGKIGEDLACEELARRGYAILARRYRSRVGEIDIVARDGQTMVFVEVKTREGEAYGGGAEAVTAFKRQRIGRVALDYLARHRLTACPCRFDVVAIALGSGGPAIHVYQNAFDLSC